MQLEKEKKPEFDCPRDCNGACCQGIYIGSGDAAGAEIMELRGMRTIKNTESGFFDIFSPPCRFLSPGGLCSVQSSLKPMICRKFEIGGPACLVMRKLWCPGPAPQKDATRV